MKHKFRLRILSYLVMAYMFLAFGWWSILLHKKNKEAFEAKKELIITQLKSERVDHSDNVLVDYAPYIVLYKKYKRQESMIFGEGLVFVISLLMGMWFIYRGYRRQVETAEEKRNFLLSITHELKSPLSSLKIATETLSKRTLNKDQQKMLMDNSQRDIIRLQKLVENLLLAAKLETNYEPVFRTIDLSDEILQCIDQFRSIYPNVKFDTASIPSHINIQADQSGLLSVIFNLIENAVKYSTQQPTVQIDITETKDNIRLIIADHGIGIPKSERTHVFNRFYRVGSEETRKTKGTGLGLYIIDRIAKAHNWTIHITDNLPQGTKVELRIPRE